MGNSNNLRPGPHLSDGSAINNALGRNWLSYQDGITAFAGGGQANAVVLSSAVNRVTTVATAADSVALPISTPGANVNIYNGGANALQLFSNKVSNLANGNLDTINGTAGATGISIAAGKSAQLTCYAAGIWVGPVALA